MNKLLNDVKIKFTEKQLMKNVFSHGTIRGHIDSLRTEINGLYIQGWFVDLLMEQPEICLRVERINEESTYSCIKVDRFDVREKYGLSITKLGFEMQLNIHEPVSCEIYLECQSGAWKMSWLIGCFETNVEPEIPARIIPLSAEKMYLKDIHSYIKKDEKYFYALSDYAETIDIIVPVYNGYEFLRGLFESIPKTTLSYRLFVVNDCSSDERVLAFLEECAKKDSKIILLNNEANMGFVQSINRALEQTKNHVVIINTDVILPENWLERLMFPIIKGKNIASSTPFTNSGTICSFPNLGENNELFPGLSLQDIDDIFRDFQPYYHEIPTGVGFCMGMNKDVIQKIGGFDAETFYKGYGEENDWCQRAIQIGYHNVMVENLFVWHKHGGSFLSEDKLRYIEHNHRVLLERFPKYDEVVAEYVRRNPMQYVRGYAKWILQNRNATSCRFVFDHDWGGGAGSYIERQIQEWNDFGDCVYRIVSDQDQMLYVELHMNGQKTLLYVSSFDEIAELLMKKECREIIVNEVVSFAEISKTLDFIENIHQNSKAKLTFLVHDYYCICPSLHLMNNKNTHCHKPDIEICKVCIKRNPNKINECCENIVIWRKLWYAFLMKCDEVRVFSNSSKGYLLHWYPELCNIVVVPHNVDYIIPRRLGISKDGILTITYIGKLMYIKGGDIMCELADLIKKRNISARVVVIGPDSEVYDNENIILHGAYNREELLNIIEAYHTDVIFIASVCPETFSYTTEEAMSTGLPIACFNLGAPAERLKNYDKAIILEDMNPESVLERLLEECNI